VFTVKCSGSTGLGFRPYVSGFGELVVGFSFQGSGFRGMGIGIKREWSCIFEGGEFRAFGYRILKLNFSLVEWVHCFCNHVFNDERSRFERLILSHQARFTCECNNEDIIE